MTTLTEQLKQGKLLDNHHYYYKLPNGKYEVGNTFCLETLHWCKDGEKIEILEEVPSYEKWQETETQRIKLMTKLNDVNNENHALCIENTKLKELFKQARGCVAVVISRSIAEVNGTDTKKLLAKIDQVLGEE